MKYLKGGFSPFCPPLTTPLIDLDNINLDNNFDEDDSDSIILIRLLAYHIKFEKGKELIKKLNKVLMPITWHRNR